MKLHFSEVMEKLFGSVEETLGKYRKIVGEVSIKCRVSVLDMLSKCQSVKEIFA